MYKRVLTEVVNHNNVNINKEMMKQGLVVLYPYQKGCNDYKLIEKTAKDAKKGVWNDQKFEMPWDYRKKMVIF